MKEKLKHIFQNDYPGVSTFIKEVIEPIFAEDSITSIDLDIIDTPEKRRRADNANIQSAQYVADIVRADSDPIAIYDVTLKPNSVIAHSRVAIKQFITADVMTYTHVFILFHYAEEVNRAWRFSYVYKEATTAATRVVAKRYTYVFGKDYRCRTAVDRFIELSCSPKSDEDFAKAFSVENLSDEFFEEYKKQYIKFVKYISGKVYEKKNGKWQDVVYHAPQPFYSKSFNSNDKTVRDYVKKLFGRIVFMYFLQRKKWLAKDSNYMSNLYANAGDLKENFLDEVLEPLFFGVLNTRPEERNDKAKLLPGCDKIPYLNGGLFQNDSEDDKQCVFPGKYFKDLFDFFDRYNFTIDENDPEDAEVGIDPEMLGRIFENLLEDNKDKGAYYTPKEIVEYMCRESIIFYLQSKASTEVGKQQLREFVETLNGETLTMSQRKFIKDWLKAVKICDSAIGSGAFPMGMVNLLSKLYHALHLSTDFSIIKRHIMEQNIYGVDIEKGAVDIARLRFWLAMIVEEKEPMPLPNLHFKIMQGNSLLESYQGVDLSDMTKVKPKTRSLFDSDDYERETLVADLKKYYATSDHAERDYLFKEIIKNVRRQLIAKDITLPQGMDLSANTEFFLWHTWFADVFENGGFDIVIGNPPYIDSETMTSLMPDIRKLYKKNYSTAQGNWDMFVIFIELGISLTRKKGVFTYIVPNKLIASKYAESCRRLIQLKNLKVVRDYGHLHVFDAAVYPCVLLLCNETIDSGPRFEPMLDLIQPKASINIRPSVFKNDLFWDKYFINSDILNIILKISNNLTLKDLGFIVKGAATVAEAYLIKEVISDGGSDNRDSFKFVNTGTIDKYKSLWGEKKTQYIKDGYMYPIVLLSDLQKISENRLIQARSPKIIVAGMCSSIEALYDDGEIIAGKSTSIILGNELDLKSILPIINSKLLDFWLRINYNSLKMSGGYINIGVNEINSLPIHSYANYTKELIHIAEKLSSFPDNKSLLKTADMIVFKIYELSYDEVLIVDPETPITREQYENFNIEDICLD